MKQEFWNGITRMRWTVILLVYGLLGTMLLLFMMGFREEAILVAAVTGVVGVIGIIAAPDTPAQMPASMGEKMMDTIHFMAGKMGGTTNLNCSNVCEGTEEVQS